MDDLPGAYLDLLKNCLTRAKFDVPFRPVMSTGRKRKVATVASTMLSPLGLTVVEPVTAGPADRIEGKDQPWQAETMIGLKRMDNLQDCIRTVIRDCVPGDLAETGVWRGGASIFMRGALMAYGDADRLVWAADSFAGLPPPSGRYAADVGDKHSENLLLAVSLEEVQANFARYGLLDDRVRFLKGWFSDTLPTAPIDRLAILRLDGDMYESTIDAITALYPKLSSGGFLIVDDYGAIEACKQAIHDYRGANHLTEPMITIDWTGVFWRKA